MYFFNSDANKKEYLKDTPIVTSNEGLYIVGSDGYRSFVQPEKILKVKDWKKKKDHIKNQEKYWSGGTNVDTVVVNGEVVGYSVRQRGFVK